MGVFIVEVDDGAELQHSIPVCLQTLIVESRIRTRESDSLDEEVVDDVWQLERDTDIPRAVHVRNTMTELREDEEGAPHVLRNEDPSAEFTRKDDRGRLFKDGRR